MIVLRTIIALLLTVVERRISQNERVFFLCSSLRKAFVQIFPCQILEGAVVHSELLPHTTPNKILSSVIFTTGPTHSSNSGSITSTNGISFSITLDHDTLTIHNTFRRSESLDMTPCNCKNLGGIPSLEHWDKSLAGHVAESSWYTSSVIINASSIASKKYVVRLRRCLWTSLLRSATFGNVSSGSTVVAQRPRNI